MSKDLVQPQPSPDQPLCDHPGEWRFSHSIAIVGIGFAILGPVASFSAFLIGREPKGCMGFALLFFALGFIILWLAAVADPGPSSTESGDRTESAPRSPMVETK